MRPIIHTQITQHTLWQALTGELPPLDLRPMPVSSAVIDSRDATPGSMFVALVGEHADGHDFITQALDNGASTIICEPRGKEQAEHAGALIVECGNVHSETRVTSDAGFDTRPLAYIVESSLKALQTVGGFQRLHRTNPELRVVGVTGSVGKTSTKELAASVLGQRYHTLHNKGNLNNEQGLPLTLLEFTPQHERAVLEMGMYTIGEIRMLCRLARPHVGIVTNVGPSHLERPGTIERIAQAKAELVQALPDEQDGGVAILNWDDEWVRPMAEMTGARVFRYGLSDDADLWADEIESAGLEGIRFRFHYRPPGSEKTENLYVRVPLLGRHSVHTALRAAAVGLVEGLTWEEIVAGLQNIKSQLRLVVTPGINRSKVLDDTYNASPASTLAALNLLADLKLTGSGRRVAVLGDMRELGSYTDEGHRAVGIRAKSVADVLVTVGHLGRIIGEEALAIGFDESNLHMVDTATQAIALLMDLVQPEDIVLVKGSRAVGMDRIVAEISLSPHQSVAGKEQR